MVGKYEEKEIVENMIGDESRGSGEEERAKRA